MLQQTRAQTVVPYFERWMRLFPDIQTLASAPLETVIKAWEGLGYYSRARNLHVGAQQILREYSGKIPDDKNSLLKIQGVGPYTANAILSFGFHKRAVPLDGNVLRVGARYGWIEGDIQRKKVRQAIEEEMENILDQKSPWTSAEALIELGATLCLPTHPRCQECPLQTHCKGAARGNPQLLPVQKARAPIEKLVRGVAVVESDGHWLVKKNEKGVVMAGLFEFPYFEKKKSEKGVKQALQALLGSEVLYVKQLYKVSHSFTRFEADLFPYHFTISHRIAVEGFVWILKEKLPLLPFSSGHKKICQTLLESE